MLRSFKGTPPPGTFYASLFLLLSPTKCSCSVGGLPTLKNDEFTASNPQVGVLNNLSAGRCLLRAGMPAWKVSPDPRRAEALAPCHPQAPVGRKAEQGFRTLRLTTEPGLHTCTLSASSLFPLRSFVC